MPEDPRYQLISDLQLLIVRSSALFPAEKEVILANLNNLDLATLMEMKTIFGDEEKEHQENLKQKKSLYQACLQKLQGFSGQAKKILTSRREKYEKEKEEQEITEMFKQI